MAESAEVISLCLNLMRRLPPKDIENSLAGLLSLAPNATDELLQRVDQVQYCDCCPCAQSAACGYAKRDRVRFASFVSIRLCVARMAVTAYNIAVGLS